MANEQYQQNSHKSRSERLDSWASRLWRGIELVFKSLDCFIVRLLELRGFFFVGVGGCSAPMHLLFGAVY